MMSSSLRLLYHHLINLCCQCYAVGLSLDATTSEDGSAVSQFADVLLPSLLTICMPDLAVSPLALVEVQLLEMVDQVLNNVGVREAFFEIN
jgi:phage tail protein X